MSRCPCHPEEERHPAFEELDRLIAAGWGSVPQTEIERIRRRNGGVLPVAPKSSSNPREFREWAGLQFAAGVAQNEVVLAAVRAGFNTAPQVAEAVGVTSKRVSAALCYLAQDGLIERIASRPNSVGLAKMFVYRVAKAVAA